MALAERAELVARLSLKDDFSGKLRGVSGSLRGMEGSLGRIAGHAKRGLGTAATNLAKIGAVATGFIALNVRSGIQSLAELEDATTAVDGAIKQMGLTGKVTSQQIAAWANEIERDVQAAFDDKEITQAATTLLRFGKITTDNLRPAMVVMTDLAAKTGDVGSASSLLAKALAAPEKAAGRLARVGVVLTDQQQDQIAAFVAAGKVGKAQALVLDAIAKATGGAAAAAKGPYNDAMNILKDTTEDAQRLLAEGFLPLLQRVADKLSTAIADPKVMDQVREFGKTLAGGFDKLLTIAGNIPWAQIGDSLKLAGTGAKAVFDAFAGMPPWVQQAVLTSWGLNKLTGGAVFKIGVELVSGAVGGVFGQFLGRGSPGNPMHVIGPGLGGPGGAGGAGGAAAGLLGTAGLLAGFVAIGESAAALPGAFTNFGAGLDALSKKDIPAAKTALQDLVAGMPQLNPLTSATGLIDVALKNWPAEPLNVKPFTDVGDSHNRAEWNAQKARDDAQRAAIEAARIATVTAIGNQGSKAEAATDRVRDKIEAARIAQVSAIGVSQTAIVDKVGLARDAIEAARIAQVSRIDATTLAVNSARDKIEAARIATVSALGTAQGVIANRGSSDADRIVNAIHGIPAPKITVSVSSGVGAGATVVKTGQSVNRSGLSQPGRRDPL